VPINHASLNCKVKREQLCCLKNSYLTINKQVSIDSFLDWEGHHWVTHRTSQEVTSYIRDDATLRSSEVISRPEHRKH